MAWNKKNKIHDLVPNIEKGSSVGFADVIAPTVLHVETLAKYQIVSEDKAVKREYEFASKRVLPTESSNESLKIGPKIVLGITYLRHFCFLPHSG